MLKNNIIKLFLLSGIFLISCAGPGRNLTLDNSSAQPEQSFSGVIWEPVPKPVVEGNDGQLLVRTSESMTLLYAAHNKDGKQNLFITHTKNIGDRFSGTIPVNLEAGGVSAHGENGPKLRQGKGRGIFAAWVSERDIKFARSMNFGKSFGPALRVNDDEGKSSQSFFTMEVAPDGAIYLAWLDGRNKKTGKPGTSSVYIARSIDQGKTFEENIRIAGDVCPCCRTALAFGDNGEIFASWRHVYEDNERIIVVATSLDGGKTWGEPVKITEAGWKINGCAHSGPAMKYVGSKLLLTWYTGKDDKASLKFAHSSDQGKSFQVVENLQGSVLDANHPDITVIGKDAWVIFQGRDPKLEGGWGPDKAWLVQVNGDVSISDPSALPSTGGGVVYPYLFKGNGGRVYAVWTEIGEEGPRVMLCRGRIRNQEKR
ncbi:MAG: exo-alpha-sialidase [Nitrospinae bacterium]|nr:exo-alpha-sialidase [Nitrospinota bacterium]MBL7021271.1 exo-alpha-sialidase [Nitrospinaceae bacterium]